MTVNINELISQFRSFCGEDRYRKFLKTINTDAIHKHRLYHWQEELWNEFCNTHHHHEYLYIPSDDLLNAFRICHIHEQRLLDDHVPADYGYRRFPLDYSIALEESFPFANMMYCDGPSKRERHANHNVKYCPTCRDTLLKWNANRKDKIGIP